MTRIEASLETRDVLPEAMAAKSARPLLVSIEKRTAYLKALSRHAMHLFLTRHAVYEHRAALAEALAGEQPVRVSIRDVEHYAPQWQRLVPEDPAVRASLAHLLTRQYIFTHAMIPHTRSALGLDQAAVQQAYQELYAQPLETIYAQSVPLSTRIHNALHAVSVGLERLPPFWIAFALTLPVGPGLLALPIALADVGALAGVVLLIIFGIINMLTVAAMAEVLARSADMRYDPTYFLGHLVGEYLGRAGSLIFTVMMVLDLLLVLLVFYLGVASTLADATQLPPALWAALLFLIGIYFLSRKSLNTTLGLVIVIGIINVTLILILTLLAFSQVQLANLFYVNVPILNGQPLNAASVQLIFGVLLATYFSHTLIGNYGKLLLRRDPSARALIRGSVASIAFTTLLSCLWVVGMNGALAPAVLRNEAGTVIIPLSARLGPVVDALGSIFVILGLGIASIHVSLGLFFTVREWLARGRLGSIELREPVRTILTMSPVAFVFLVAEWLVITKSGSFSGLFGFSGVIALSLFAGIFPMLLLFAARRKGELVPQAGVYKWLGHPVLVVGLYLFFLAAIFLHGTVLWNDALWRAGALALGLAIFSATLVMVRHHAFAPRLVVELRREALSPHGEQPARAEYAITAVGQPYQAQVRLVYPDRAETTNAAWGDIQDFERMTRAEFEIAPPPVRDLKLTAHSINHEGDAESLPARVAVQANGENNQFNIHESGGAIILPLSPSAQPLNLTLTPAASDPNSQNPYVISPVLQ